MKEHVTVENINNRTNEVVKFLKSEIVNSRKKNQEIKGNTFLDGVSKLERNHIRFCEKILKMLGVDIEE